MRKLLLLSIIVAIFVTACGQGIDNSLAGTTTTTTTSSTSTTTTTTTTTLPTTETTSVETTTTTEPLPPADPIVVWIDPALTGAIAAPAEAFETALGIPIEIVAVSDSVMKNAVLNPNSDDKPDVFAGPHLWMGDLIAAGAIAPLGMDARTAEFVDVAAESFTFDGSLYGAPYALDTTVLHYNPSLVTDPPGGFSQVKAICEDLGNTIDECVVIPLHDPANTYPFLSAQGGYLFGSGETGVDVADVGIDSDGAVAGAEFLQDLIGDGIVDDRETLGGAAAGFIEGTTPFVIAGYDAVEALSAGSAPAATATIPIMGGQNPVPLVSATGFYLGAASEQPDAAAVFIREYLVTTPTMTAIYNTAPAPPAYLAVAEEPPAADEQGVFLSSAANGEPLDAVPDIEAVLEVLQPAFAALYDRRNDPSEVLGTAADAIRVIVGVLEEPSDDGGSDG